MYESTIRPVAEYASVVLHSMLSAEQSDIIERQQNHALKLIFGTKLSAEKMRKLSGVRKLSERRFDACKKFAQKASESQRFGPWFKKRPAPIHSRRASVSYELFHEKISRTDRCYNSPLHYFRRLLNGKVTQ